MQTRRRDYVKNPRSPPRRRRRNTRKKEILQELATSIPSPTPSTHSTTQPNPTSHTQSSTPTEGLADALSTLKLQDSESFSHYTVGRSIKSYPAPHTEPFQSQEKLFNHIPKQHSQVLQSIMSTEQKLPTVTLTAQDITEARENLGDETKFDHLLANGTNFMDWKKNTARAI